MRSHKLLLTLLVVLCFGIGQPALAAVTEEELADAVFHTEYTDDEGEKGMREGLESLWSVIRPHMTELGHTRFPPVHIWGFNTKAEAARVTGLEGWDIRGGYAVPGSAYMLVGGNEKGARRITAHELMHVVQQALNGSRGHGSQCIAEGAATWYSEKALAHVENSSFENTLRAWKRLNSEDRITGVSAEAKEQLTEYGYEPNPFPAFSELTTPQQFQNAHRERERIYTLCALAFELLLETGGGDAAYFEYMSEVGRTDWQTAFNRAFEEDLDTFQQRFKAYRESWFEDYRLPHEIRHDQVISELLDCRNSGFWASQLCMR